MLPLLLLLPLRRVSVCFAVCWLALAADARADAVLLRFYPPQGVVAGYRVYAALQTTGPIASPPIDTGARAPDGTGIASYSLGSLDPASAYSVELTAYDARGVESRRSNRVTVAPRVETLGSAFWKNDFSAYAPDVHVPGFVDARGDSSTWTGSDLFGVSYFGDGNAAFGTDADSGVVSTRWIGVGASQWGSYEISGRVWVGGPNVQAGIAARVTGDDGSRYFELGQNPGGAWLVRGRNEPALTCRSGSATGVTQAQWRWYSLRLRVTRASALTRLRAKVWRFATPEPPAWQVDCWTTLAASADSGGFALLRGGALDAFFDDVAVTPVVGKLDPIPPQ